MSKLSPDGAPWHDEADVIVVGFGGAGACAALAAKEAGADVLVLDRFGGGGATALSGGVYYGGGTRYQREAGFDDDAENMYRYLKHEVGDAVSDSTLRRFCKQSAENLEWLANQGIAFKGTVAPDDAPYMAPGYHLYFSGNERAPSYRHIATPAPRGHIAVGDVGQSAGLSLFAALERAVLKSGVRVLRHSPVTRLIQDSSGAVIGVETRTLREGSYACRAHARYLRCFDLCKGLLYGPPARFLQRRLERLERRGETRLIHARRGVILATGGFIHNRGMVQRYLPRHTRAITLGSPGCTGAGIKLGASIGAQTARMQYVDSARSLIIPKVFACGMLVDGEGHRFIAEDAYGATIGHEIIGKHDGKAWLILDAALYRAAWKPVMPWRPMLIRYRVRALMPLLFAWRRGRNLEAVARKCRIPPDALLASLRHYNEIVSAGADPLGKQPAHLRPLGKGPFYAINCSTDSVGYPPTSFTLGGLAIDEQTGQVLNADQQGIPCLYAAGRTAVGIPSNFYVSGLSIADCVFSGRRAGNAAYESIHATSAVSAAVPR